MTAICLQWAGVSLGSATESNTESTEPEGSLSSIYRTSSIGFFSDVACRKQKTQREDEFRKTIFFSSLKIWTLRLSSLPQSPPWTFSRETRRGRGRTRSLQKSLKSRKTFVSGPTRRFQCAYWKMQVQLGFQTVFSRLSKQHNRPGWNECSCPRKKSRPFSASLQLHCVVARIQTYSGPRVQTRFRLCSGHMWDRWAWYGQTFSKIDHAIGQEQILSCRSLWDPRSRHWKEFLLAPYT